MPFQRPTLAQLIDRTRSEVESRLGTGPLLRRSILGVLARVLAGASHLLHGHLDWISRQALPDTAEQAELERWASIKGISRKPGARASGDVEATGTDGSVIPAGTELKRSDGRTYETQAGGTVSGGVATVTVEADERGLDGDSEEGTQLTFTSPVAGVQARAVVIAPGIGGGADLEDDEALRERLLFAFREQPQGGAQADYVRWALEVDGVTRAWAFDSYLGLGTVGVGFAVDDDPSGPIPSPAKVAEVQAYIEERRPVTADVFVFAPTALEVDISIQLVPNDVTTQNAVIASLADMFLREASPGGTIPLSHLHEAVSTSPGEFDHEILSPFVDVVAPTGFLPVLGQVVWM